MWAGYYNPILKTRPLGQVAGNSRRCQRLEQALKPYRRCRRFE
ncbi:hypothetical protein D1AOALGA4SA_9891 [Olavius algarvensis Delta 1 endosymbiont]|nr:hypothetical protein D1AOALGA4SA_9891 [Olavius algarvensis Delta 1 endosymbiont]